MGMVGGYRPQLDGLRAVAVTLVLLGHFALDRTVIGHVGVRIFFVLSGYLITGILLQARDAREAGQAQPLRHFYIRRILRLWPAYYLLLGVALIANIDNIRSVAPWHLVQASNILFAWRNAFVPPVTAHWWSLAVEEQFYLVWPLVVFFLPRRWLVPAIIAAIGMANVGRAFIPMDDIAYLTLPFMSFDALAAGALVTVAERRGPMPGWLLPGTLLLGAITLVVLLLPLPFGLNLHLSEALTAPLFAGLVALAASGRSPSWLGRVLCWPPILYIGRISYGVYLYHLFILLAMWKLDETAAFLAHHRMVMFLIGSAATIIVATASWYMIERPINALKRRYPFP
ncbi:MAG: acyltransferase [Sphingomonadaceae bacterium]|nr:acyltransferase [Sphingomonadaceae bacterium]